MHTTKPEVGNRQAPLHQVEVIEVLQDDVSAPWMHEHLQYVWKAADFSPEVHEVIPNPIAKIVFERTLQLTLRSTSTVPMNIAVHLEGIDEHYRRNVIGAQVELPPQSTRHLSIEATHGFGIGRMILMGFVTAD